MGFCTELFHFQDLVSRVWRRLCHPIDVDGHISEKITLPPKAVAESGAREVGSAEDGQLRLSLNSQFFMRLRNSLDDFIFKTLLKAVFKIVHVRTMALMEQMEIFLFSSLRSSFPILF